MGSQRKIGENTRLTNEVADLLGDCERGSRFMIAPGLGVRDECEIDEIERVGERASVVATPSIGRCAASPFDAVRVAALTVVDAAVLDRDIDAIR